MRNSRWFRIAPLALACLAGTRAWADPDTADDSRPAQPRGPTARVGTTVGSVYGEPTDVLALGVSAAVGHRFGRFAVETEYTYLSFQTLGVYMSDFGPMSGDIPIGSGQRLALLARYDIDVIPFGSSPETYSMLAFYVEGGVGLAWNHWDQPGPDDPARLVPVDSQRVEGQTGFGIMLDHHLRSSGSPKRVGWFLGLRLAMSPHQPMAAAICRGVACSAVPMMDDGGGLVDRSMLFQSSLEFTF